MKEMRRLAVTWGLMAAMASVSTAWGGPLNPDAFTPNGVLNLGGGPYTFDTSTYTFYVNGAPTIAGVNYNGIAVFDFSEISMGGATVNVTGSNPLALLSQGDISIQGGIINLDGGNGGNDGSGGGGGGLVLVLANTYTISGSINLAGGSGGSASEDAGNGAAGGYGVFRTGALVPEPSSLVTLAIGTGLIVLVGVGRHRKASRGLLRQGAHLAPPDRRSM